METVIRCKKCGHDKFVRTNKPAIPNASEQLEFREFACAKCGELIYYECPLEYIPEYNPSTGLTAYHDTLEDALSTDVDDDYGDDILLPEDFPDFDGGFDPGIG